MSTKSGNNVQEVPVANPETEAERPAAPSNGTGETPSSRRNSSRRMTTKLEFNEEFLQTIKAYGMHLNLHEKLEVKHSALIGLSETRYIHFYRQLLCEFYGTFVLVAVGCNCITPYNTHASDASLDMSSIILAWGFIVACLVWTIAHVSGCFLNPAVTLAMFVNRRVPLVRALAYIAVEIPGAIAAAAFHKYLRGDKLVSTCQTLLHHHMGVDQAKGFTVEFFITFFLVFFVFATIDHNREDHGGSHAFMVGGVIIVLVNFGAEMTGAGMNPARSFGPALIHGNWDDHWVYWVAPITGGCLGGTFYDLFFSERMIAWQRQNLVDKN